jgi:hypothetical protein
MSSTRNPLGLTHDERRARRFAAALARRHAELDAHDAALAAWKSKRAV